MAMCRTLRQSGLLTHTAMTEGALLFALMKSCPLFSNSNQRFAVVTNCRGIPESSDGPFSRSTILPISFSSRATRALSFEEVSRTAKELAPLIEVCFN
jgi:hypothetical protein